MTMTLEPCPFCGGTYITRTLIIDGSGCVPERHHVMCCDCGAEIGAETEQIADAYWNRRTHLSQPAQAVDVGAIREVIVEMRDSKYFDRNGWIQDWADKLTRAIGTAQEG